MSHNGRTNGPDEDGNPVGLVCIAIARANGETIPIEKRYGDLGRDGVQERAMADALAALVDVVETDGIGCRAN